MDYKRALFFFLIIKELIKVIIGSSNCNLNSHFKSDSADMATKHYELHFLEIEISHVNMQTLITK